MFQDQSGVIQERVHGVVDPGRLEERGHRRRGMALDRQRCSETMSEERHTAYSAYTAGRCAHFLARDTANVRLVISARLAEVELSSHFLVFLV